MGLRLESELCVQQDVLRFTSMMCNSSCRDYNDLAGQITGSLWCGHAKRPLTAELASDVIIA